MHMLTFKYMRNICVVICVSETSLDFICYIHESLHSDTYPSYITVNLKTSEMMITRGFLFLYKIPLEFTAEFENFSFPVKDHMLVNSNII